jgi:hypothetical protein
MLPSRFFAVMGQHPAELAAGHGRSLGGRTAGTKAIQDQLEKAPRGVGRMRIAEVGHSPDRHQRARMTSANDHVTPDRAGGLAPA